MDMKDKKEELSKYQKRHIQYVNNKTAKAIVDNNLINKDDKVLVAVSGGKDSLVLLEVLSTLRQYHFLDFDMEAVHIDVEEVPYKVSADELNKLCDKVNVPVTYLPVSVNLDETEGKAPCFVCAWHRRKAIFTYAEQNGFDKVAMGHHMDDAVETLIINMAYHGNISSLPPKLSMFDGKIVIIRPLLLLTNKDTQEYANIRNFPKQTETCPYEDKTRRNTAKEIIEQMKSISPLASKNIFKSMGNIDEGYLPF